MQKLKLKLKVKMEKFKIMKMIVWNHKIINQNKQRKKILRTKMKNLYQVFNFHNSFH